MQIFQRSLLLIFSCSWHLFSFLVALYLSSFVGHFVLVILILDQYGRTERYFKCFRERFTLYTFVFFFVSSRRCLNLILLFLSVAFLPKIFQHSLKCYLQKHLIYELILLKSVRKYLLLKTCIIQKPIS